MAAVAAAVAAVVMESWVVVVPLGQATGCRPSSGRKFGRTGERADGRLWVVGLCVVGFEVESRRGLGRGMTRRRRANFREFVARSLLLHSSGKVGRPAGRRAGGRAGGRAVVGCGL